MAVIVDQKLNNNTTDITVLENKFITGDVGELRLYLSQDMTDDELKSLEDNIKSKGGILTEPIKEDARTLVIKFQKASDPLVLITDTLSSLGINFSAWQLIKSGTNSTVSSIPTWLWVAGGLSLLLIWYLALRKNDD